MAVICDSQQQRRVAIADLDGDGDLDVFVSTNTWTGAMATLNSVNQLKTNK
jgi:hypothetical protein